jgi:biopolymer transport protein ExbD
MTAMLDVTFNLLLFFVVTTTFRQDEAQQSPGIQVDLPRSSAQAILADDKDLDVWMTADGALLVDDQPVDFAGLRAIFKDRAAKDPGTQVVIRADTGVSHGRVVAVMDNAKAFGLSRLAIATQANAGEGEGAAPPGE